MAQPALPLHPCLGIVHVPLSAATSNPHSRPGRASDTDSRG